MDNRTEQIKKIVKEGCAKYLQTVTNGTSMITVTDATVSPDMRKAKIFISVLPISGEESALNFAKRNRNEMRSYLREHMSSRNIPFLDVEIDQGEKNRQKIDDLLRQG